MSDDLTRVSDATLVVAIARSRQDALAEAYSRYSGAVFGLATRVLADRALAEEVLQEVFLRLWNEPERFDPDRGSLRSFLLAQCHGRAVDLIRSEEARRRREERQHRQPNVPRYDLEDEVMDVEIAGHVRDALALLPRNEREPIELAYFGGKSYREVAAALGQPEGTVKTRIRSGLRRLRAGLTDIGVGATP